MDVNLITPQQQLVYLALLIALAYRMLCILIANYVLPIKKIE
jgi:hypothetical protein